MLAIAYSPDGKTIATGGEDGLIRLFDAASGNQFGAPSGHQSGVSTLAMSPDGSRLISGGCDQTVRVWEIPSGNPIRTFTWNPDPDRAMRPPIASVSVSGDGARLAACASWQSEVRIWDMAMGRLISELRLDPVGVEKIRLTRKGESVLVAGIKGRLALWNTGTGDLLREYCRGDGHHWGDLAISADETMFTYRSSQTVEVGERGLSDDRCGIKVYSLQTGDLLSTQNLSGKSSATFSAFCPDGKTIALGLLDWDAKIAQPLRLFEVATGREVLAFGAGGTVRSIAVSPDGKTVVAGYYDGTIDLWDRYSGALSERFQTEQVDIACLVFTPDGKWLFSGGGNGTIYGWSMNPGTDRAP